MATIADMQAYNMLQKIGPMNEGLALGGEEEGGRSPYEPYKPAPSGPYSPPPKRKELASGPGYHTTSSGGIVDMSGRVFYNDNGTLRLDGDYDEKIHGELFPPIDEANRSMQINQDIARDFTYGAEPGGVVTPRYFTPPELRDYFRTPAIKEKELFHFNNFIRSMGGGLDTVRRRTPLSIANLPYQDGRAPTRPFYNAPYSKPDLFIKDKQSIDDAKKRFKLNTGIDLAKR